MIIDAIACFLLAAACYLAWCNIREHQRRKKDE